MPPPSWTRHLPHLPMVAVDALIGVLGVWQLLALVAVYGGLSFDVLFLLGFVSLVGLGLPLWTRPWETPPEAPAPAPPNRQVVWGALTLALASWASFQAGMAALPSVAFGVAPLALLFAAPRSAVPLGDGRASRGDGLAIVAVAIAAAAVTLNLHRADVDDGYYMNAVIQTLAQPDKAVLSFDGIHGVEGAPIQQVIHRPQTFEVLVAWVARLMGLSGRFTYWVVVPAGFAALSALTHWALAKRIAPQLAALAVVVAFGVMLVWGDGAQTIGRFGYVRLFQGKSVFVTTMMPLLATALLHHAAAPSPRSLLRLALAALGVTTFTSTALIVVPIAIALGGLGGLRLSKASLRPVLLGWTTAVPVIATLLLLYVELKAAGGLASDGHEMRATAALGRFRSATVLVALAATPWLLGGKGASVWLARVLGVALLVLLNGVAPGLLGDAVAELLNWRTFWAVPFVPLLGVAGAAALHAGWRAWPERAGEQGLRLLMGLALAAAMVTRGNWALQGDGASFQFAAEKTSPRYEAVADLILEHAGPLDVVAAPPQVSQALAMRVGKPKLNAVWIRYVLNLTRFWGQEETDRRLDILRYVRGKDVNVPAQAVQLQCVSVLVVVTKNRGKGNSTSVLNRQGFELVGTKFGNDVYVRPASALPRACQQAREAERAATE